MGSIIVTGASRGLGLAIAHRLAAAGNEVIAIARHESVALAAAQAEVDTSRGALHFRPFDLADVSLIPDLVKDLRNAHGAFDGLVNNAGLGTSGILATMRDPEIERIVRLNTVSPLILTKYVVRSMMTDSRAGRIVNIASIVGFAAGYSGVSVYSATKASLVGFTRSLAREVGPLGITVNAVAPGFIDTEMTRGISEGQRRQLMRRAALHRLAEAEDVAAAVEFLLGENARNVTGTVLTVDAGNTA